jgi:signal transduction histidine kinase
MYVPLEPQKSELSSVVARIERVKPDVIYIRLSETGLFLSSKRSARGGDEGVAFVIDLTDRKKAKEVERRYRQVQTELAHANRLATMGQLSASIAHEINQPIGSAITYANAALSWLPAQPPNLEEVQQALGFIVESGVQAGEVIDRIRALVKKSTSSEGATQHQRSDLRGHRAGSRRNGKQCHFRKDATCG